MKALFMTTVFVALSVLVAPFVFSKNATQDSLSDIRPKIQQLVQTQDVRTVRLTFVGDIMLDRYIRAMNEATGYTNILPAFSPLLKESDFVVANLEGPVTQYRSHSLGTLPGEPGNFVFTFSPDALPPLFDADIRAVSLGNNHILNFGDDGLTQTKTYLENTGIAFFGDPRTQSTLIKDVNGISVGFVAFNEFFPFDEEDLMQTIHSLSEITDFTVVYAHWGAEYETTPNTLQQQLAHRFVDAGADVVVGAHPHVIQNKEIYNGKTIFYSLGNFIFDQYWMDSVRCGAVVTLTITPPKMTYTTEESFVWLQKDGSTVLSTCMNTIPELPPLP